MIVLVLVTVLAPPSGAQTLELTQPLAEISFGPGGKTLDADDLERLRAAAIWAHDNPWRMLVIEAHADERGSMFANLALSQARADAVRDALLQLGVPPERLIDAPYGEEGAAPGRYVRVRGTLRDFRGQIEREPEPIAPAQRP